MYIKHKKTLIILASFICLLIGTYYIANHVIPPIASILQLFSYGDALSKDKIFKLVTDNHDILNKAIVEIDSLEDYVKVIADTKYRKPGRETIVRGLYTGGVVNKEYVYKSLDNATFKDILKNGDIKSISISRTGIIPAYTDQINFDCGGKGMDYYCGFYYSKSGEPDGFNGQKWTFEKDGSGWLDMGGETYYYTEQISGNWYYYEMEFSAQKRIQDKIKSREEK